MVFAGYSAAFLSLAGIAAAGAALFWLGMPETAHPQAVTEPRAALLQTGTE